MKIRTMFCIVLVSLATVISAQEIPLGNWAAPATWGPSHADGERSAQIAINDAVPFYPVLPCRVYDSRSASILAGGSSRTIDVDGNGACPGIPASGVKAYSLNITVFGSTANGSYAFLTAYPSGSTRPTVATLNFLTGAQVGNAAVVPTGTGQDIDIYSTATTHFTVDINGFYSTELPTLSQMAVRADLGGAAAIVGYNFSNTNGSHAVGGYAGGTGAVHGVQGQIGSGSSSGSSGAHGISELVNDTAAVRGDINGLSFADTLGFVYPAAVLGRGRRGVVGIGQNNGAGLLGAIDNGAGTLAAWGAVGYHSGSDYGFYTPYAAYVGGNLAVGGTLSKAAGSFKIDDPIDPANRYLYHSFVESPDMMNIYNGVVVLGPEGTAVITMPEWFQALNRDFRYQLTAIGSPAPRLYVADEIANNHFTIAGGQPGQKVSWQVTGVRHDPYADAHRIPVEQWKPDAERGTYLHPELYGEPESLGIEQSHLPDDVLESQQK
ncbi:MAG: hypothetical protein WBX15_11275 [Thermoanaerobaculia bacterium]